MQRKAAKVLRATFDAAMKSRFPQFGGVVPSENLSGSRLYRWTADEELFCFLLLEISQKSDAFTIEAAYSGDGRFPFDLIGMSPIDIPRCDIVKSAPVGGRFRFRLPMLWVGKDFWWHLSGRPGPDDISLTEFLSADDWETRPLPEYSAEQIGSVVNDAIGKIDEYALPYFTDVSRRRDNDG